MHPDFTRLASLRRFLMTGDPREVPDFGRAQAAAWISRHGLPQPRGVTVAPLPGKAGLEITPPDPCPSRAVVYVHGGGLVYYSPQVFVPFLAQLAQRTGQRIFALDYSKAPETGPRVLMDQLTRRLSDVQRRHPNLRIALAGDSVGGLLATRLCAAARERVDGLHLIYPVCDLNVAANDPYGRNHFLDTEMMEWFYEFIRPLCTDHPAPCRMPQTDLRALPPVTIHIAGADILAPQARFFTSMLTRAGRLAACHEYPDLPHDYCLFAKSSKAADAAISTLARAVEHQLVDA